MVVRAEEAAAPAAAPKKPDVGPKRGTFVSATAVAGRRVQAPAVAHSDCSDGCSSDSTAHLFGTCSSI